MISVAIANISRTDKVKERGKYLGLPSISKKMVLESLKASSKNNILSMLALM